MKIITLPNIQKGENQFLANSCPLSENPKPISIDANIMPRKVCYGTLLVSIKKNSAIYTKAMPKYVVSNMRGPKLVWVPSKSGWLFVGTMALESWLNWFHIDHHMLSQVLKLNAIISQCQAKN